MSLPVHNWPPVLSTHQRDTAPPVQSAFMGSLSSAHQCDYNALAANEKQIYETLHRRGVDHSNCVSIAKKTIAGEIKAPAPQAQSAPTKTEKTMSEKISYPLGLTEPERFEYASLSPDMRIAYCFVRKEGHSHSHAYAGARDAQELDEQNGTQVFQQLKTAR